MQFKLDPESTLQPEIVARIEESGLKPSPEGTFEVLDVGCGPLSTVGKKTLTFRVNLTGLDPLAGAYQRLLADAGLVAPYTFVEGTGETLGDLFPAEHFDYVHSENALDHCSDPEAVLRNLVKVTKKGGRIFVRVFINEAKAAHYTGLHAWNFDVFDNQIVIWRPGQIRFLRDIIGLPYRFKTFEQYIGVLKRNREILTFEIDNIDLAVNWIPAGDSMQAIFDPLFQTLVLERTKPIDPNLNLFLHAYPADKSVPPLVWSFRWYPEDARRLLTLPRADYTVFHLGQYRTSYPDGVSEPVCENVWETEFSIEPRDN